ncbi:hypothetical protein LUZ61_020909 [Rhynchospora tenuis]|uniref:CLASP N-terminal domain-containing protein n=1 Tax=Rhynchospora tenuis TaxID=198213 RepID=A0AAD5ZEB5_9POAL|nr:hypothetical protein LUZ61_020909 [Rhynchospora tenuis]
MKAHCVDSNTLDGFRILHFWTWTAQSVHEPAENDDDTLHFFTLESDQLQHISSVDLEPLPDPDAKIKDLLIELESNDWVESCRALNDVRRFAVHHSPLLLKIWEKVMPIILTAMKSRRTAVCKTSILACSDAFSRLGQVFPFPEKEQKSAFDDLLLQLLLKASQDKGFVREEAEKALEVMAVSIPRIHLLQKLELFVNHNNIRVGAKAAAIISKCVGSEEKINHAEASCSKN